MPFSINDTGDDARNILDDGQSQSVTYTPDGGSPVVIDGIWEEEQQVPEYLDDVEHGRRRGVVQVHPDDAPSPSDKDGFTIDGDEFSVVSVGPENFLVEFEVAATTLRRVGGAPQRITR